MKTFYSNLCIISLIIFWFSHRSATVHGSVACGGFIKSIVNINYSRVSIKLLTASGNLKYASEGAPNNGYYFIPVYDNGDYVLKVDAPVGWKFEPDQVEVKIDGTNDPCTQGVDINFAFKGFTISGKILSDTLDSGPQGVTITLKDKSGSVLGNVQTKSGGDYVFEDVLPGTYEIIADDKKLSFVGSNVISVTVTDDNVVLSPKDPKETITISGYSVNGRVTSDGERIGGVNFALFSLSGKKRVPTGCNTEAIASRKVDVTASATYLCFTLSNSNGQFEFQNLSPGNYRLVAYYRGNNIEFGVEPSHIDFKIQHEHIELKSGFTVEGFSVSGKVLTRQGGKGVEGAKVLVKDDKGAEKLIKSLKDGIFHLENMKTGTYTLIVEAPHLRFEPKTVRISPSSPLIPDIVAAAFETCGRLNFKSKSIDMQMILTKSTGKEFVAHSTIETKSDGSFCSFLEPGKYRIQPKIPSGRENEIVFTPKYLELFIESKSERNLAFYQFAASVSGSLVLKEPKVSVNDIRIELISLNGQLVETVQPEDQSKEFKFTTIAPGKYKLRLRKADNMWCWKEDEITITISDKDLTGINFVQIGYYITLVTSHLVSVKLVHSSSKKVINTEIKNVHQPFRQCLQDSGQYEITTTSCHSFKNDKGHKEPFIFDTKSQETSTPLIIRAYKHQMAGTITITTLINSSDEFTLSLTRRINEDDQGSTSVLDYSLVSSTPDNQGNVIRSFKFSLSAEPNEILLIEPSSKTLLFKPPKFTFNMGSHCSLNAVSFKGRSGLFIKGSISPPLEGVHVKLYSRQTDKVIFEVNSDSSGKYIAGPLDCVEETVDSEIYAKAEKEGYLLKASPKLGDFVSEKLSSLIVKVTDADGSPLPDVLISISGGSNNFRKNLITPSNGELSFIGLNPGEYFMRSVLKEFKLDPSSRIVDIKQGETVTINVKGERVAYSCYGSLVSMSEEPEPNILVEAVGIDGVTEQGYDCKEFQEEVTSEANGNFRIRDLKPGCDYQISVKNSVDNNLISRSLPENIIISVKQSDVTDIKLILFTRANIMELTGDIITNPEFWPSLRVKLFSESIGDQLLASIPVSSGFFSIPTQIPVDNRWYILKLESTLPTYLYSFEVPTITFRANTTYSHFQFRFEPKKSLTSDSFQGEQDNINTGSLFTLPIFIILGLIFYKFDKVKPIYDAIAEKVWSTINGDGRFSSNSGDVRRKSKSRRT